MRDHFLDLLEVAELMSLALSRWLTSSATSPSNSCSVSSLSMEWRTASSVTVTRYDELTCPPPGG